MSRRGFGLARKASEAVGDRDAQKRLAMELALTTVDEDSLRVKVEKALAGVKATISFTVEELRHDPSWAAHYADVGKKRRKHASQESSIAAHLESAGLGSSDEATVQRTYVELGAGSAYLSQHLLRANRYHSRHLLVDRLTFRHRNKADATMVREARQAREADANVPTIVCERVTASIEDLDTAKLLECESVSSDTQLVFVSKHLCGPATDSALALAVRCEAHGVAIATCCHYLLDWETYSAQMQLSDFGFSPNELTVLAKRSQWATLSSEPRPGSDETVEERDAKRSFGVNIKHLFDGCRALWLQQAGYLVKLVCYTSETTDNTLLLCTRAPGEPE